MGNPVPKDHDFNLDGGNFLAKWNLSEDGNLWILKPDSVHEVGCIHTCQGLELDYVGVIIGPDLIVREGVVKTDASKRSKGDASIKGYKNELGRDAVAARAKADTIIKNTYRTLMTRGTKGCYVFSTDPETNIYLKSQGVGALLPDLEAIESHKPAIATPFRVLCDEQRTESINAVPLFDLTVAAGAFSQEQWLLDCKWVELPDHLIAKKGFFIAQVVGESMNRRIPNGAWCLFREPDGGSREGKVVLVESRDVQDPNTGRYTVKRYSSEKQLSVDGWHHQTITLSPESYDSQYHPIRVTGNDAAELRVIGELVAVIG